MCVFNYFRTCCYCIVLAGFLSTDVWRFVRVGQRVAVSLLSQPDPDLHWFRVGLNQLVLGHVPQQGADIPPLCMLQHMLQATAAIYLKVFFYVSPAFYSFASTISLLLSSTSTTTCNEVRDIIYCSATVDCRRCASVWRSLGLGDSCAGWRPLFSLRGSPRRSLARLRMPGSRCS